MPSLITHIEFAKDVYKSLDDQQSPVYRALTEHPEVYYLGAQAGDIFFYEGALRLWNKKGLSALGSEMHTHSAGLFFLSMLEKLEETENQAIPLAYYCGYLTHYLLDAFTHPFIYYWTGFPTQNSTKKEKLQFLREHFLLEKAIDVMFLETAHKETVSELIAVSEAEANILAPWLSAKISTVYKQRVSSSEVRKSIRDMQDTYDFFKDPGGFKYKFFESLSGWSTIAGYIASNIYPLQIDKQLDYLNKEKKEWHMPWDNRHQTTHGFMDLYQEAIDEARDIFMVSDRFLMGHEGKEELLIKIGNRSFKTGQDSRLELSFMYHNRNKIKNEGGEFL